MGRSFKGKAAFFEDEDEVGFCEICNDAHPFPNSAGCRRSLIGGEVAKRALVRESMEDEDDEG